MKSSFVIIVVIIAVLASCRSTRNIKTAISKKDTVAMAPAKTSNSKADSLRFIKDTYREMMSKKIDFKTFSAKINVDYVDADGKKYNVNAFVRMRKDSVIWISVTAIFGIEGLRAYITKDSVKLLDKQNKAYTARAVSYLQEVSALPLDLHTLQELLIGNPVFLDSNIVSYSKHDNEISLISIGEFFKNFVTLGAADKLITRSKLDDANVNKSRTCDLTYSDYENKGGINFSTKRKITVVEKKKLDIEMAFKQYDFNEELTYPFSIPKNYKRN